MPRELQTYGKIQAGQLKISYRDRFIEAIKAWPDCRVTLILTKQFNRRSLEQNAYLHGVVIPEIRLGMIEAGYSPAECSTEAVKDFLKFRFAKKELVNEKTGEIIETVQPTSQMNTAEMTDFIEEVRRFASEYLNRYIPSPNEQMKIL
jgi:hypothetical protein